MYYGTANMKQCIGCIAGIKRRLLLAQDTLGGRAQTGLGGAGGDLTDMTTQMIQQVRLRYLDTHCPNPINALGIPV